MTIVTISGIQRFSIEAARGGRRSAMIQREQKERRPWAATRSRPPRHRRRLTRPVRRSGTRRFARDRRLVRAKNLTDDEIAAIEASENGAWLEHPNAEGP
jgi:hypothetical protein